MTARYAIYFSPDDATALARFGDIALKRRPDGTDCASGAVFAGDMARHHEMAAFPRHYGFHATIKAPFELAESQTAGALDNALMDYCAGQSPIMLHDLAPRALTHFIALTCTANASLNALAFDIVRSFEMFRAPLSDADIARRKPERLSETQRHYLHTYGYPSVGDAFRFHMTLSGQNKPDYLAFLRALFASLVRDPVPMDRLALFMQPDRQSRFVRVASYRLGGGTR